MSRSLPDGGIAILAGVIGILLITSCGLTSEAAKHRLFEQGNEFFNQKRYREAEIAYRKALKKDARFGEAQYRLALAELEQRKIARGVASLQRAVALVPDNLDARNRLAEIYLDAYRGSDPARKEELIREAKAQIQYLEEKNPNSFDALRLSGHLAFVQEKPKEAIHLLRKAKALNPLNPALVQALVQLYLQENLGQEAETLANEFLARDKNYGPIYDLLYLRYTATQRHAEAEAILRQKVAMNPKAAGFYLQLATHYAMHSKPAEMERTLRYLLDRPSEFQSVHLEVGDFYARTGEWQNAVRRYQEGAEAHPNEKIAYQKRIVRALMSQGKQEEAIAKLDDIIREYPKDADARIMRAVLRLSTGVSEDVDRGLADLQVLAKENSGNFMVRYHLGRALALKHEFEAAHREFREAMHRRSNFLPAFISLSEVSLEMQHYKDALGYANQILASVPNHPYGRLLRASAEAGLGQTLQARAGLTNLIKEFPNFRAAHVRLGLLSLAEHNFAEAARILRQQYRPGQDDLDVIRGMAELYFSQRQFDEAFRFLKEEARQNPRTALHINRLAADLALRAQRVDQAIEAYNGLLTQRPPRPTDIHYRLAALHFMKSDFGAALTQIQLAEKWAPKDPKILEILGALLEQNGRSSEAQHYYRKALALDPENPVALNNLAYSMVETGGNLDEALSLAHRALEKVPNQPEFSDTLGWIYLKKNMANAALHIFQNLTQRHPKSSLYRYRLAVALVQKGERQRAKTELMTALASKPSAIEESRIRDLLSTL